MIGGDLLGQAQIILQGAPLTEEARTMWAAGLTHANTASLQLFISLFKNDPAEIEQATNWLRLKLKAVGGDREAARAVAKEEREEIIKALEEGHASLI